MWSWVPLVFVLGATALSTNHGLKFQTGDVEQHATEPVTRLYQYHGPNEIRPFSRKRVPAEFETQQYLLMASSSDHTHSNTIARVVDEVVGRIQPVILVNDSFDREQLWKEFQTLGIDRKDAKVIYIPHDSKWARDFGPTSVVRGRQQFHLVDWSYSEERLRDDDVSLGLSRISETDTEYTLLKMEGGNLLSNGRGIIVTSDRFLRQNNEYSTGQVSFELAKQLNASTVVVLEPLSGEDTQHVDMFAAFTSPNTIVVGSYSKDVDPVNAAILDRNAELLSKVETRHGKIRVVRIPMGSREENCWRTYTNCIFANGVLVVPSYGEFDDPAILKKVLRTYRRLLPGWEVVTVDASDLIGEGGSLRCASLNLTQLKKVLDSTPDYQLPRITDLLDETPMPSFPRFSGESHVENEWDIADLTFTHGIR